MSSPSVQPTSAHHRSPVPVQTFFVPAFLHLYASSFTYRYIKHNNSLMQRLEEQIPSTLNTKCPLWRNPLKHTNVIYFYLLSLFFKKICRLSTWKASMWTCSFRRRFAFSFPVLFSFRFPLQFDVIPHAKQQGATSR